jgi:hypothetical protein
VNKRHCPHCSEEHIVSPTYDNEVNIVGYFCNRTKLMTEGDAVWDGEYIVDLVRQYIDDNIDPVAFKHVPPERTLYLAKRFAYRLLQTDEAQKRRLNFAYLTYWFKVLLTAMKEGE